MCTLPLRLVTPAATRPALLGLLVAALLPTLAEAQKADSSASKQKVVIPFDFESKFDDGSYGQTIGDMLWQKLKRQGGFVIPETQQDVRDWSERTKTIPNPETPMDRMKDIVVKEQAGDIAIWGKVERVPPNETDVYDLWITIADFSVDPPRIIYQKKARTETVSEIPHIYVKEALDKLYERPAQVAEANPDPALDGIFKTAKNLIKGGDFQLGRDGPAGWDPLTPVIAWVPDEKKPSNKVLRFTLDKDTAENAGLLYYSEFFPVEENAKYRFQCKWRSNGPTCKVFIKCYDALSTQFQNKSGSALGMEKREVYRSQQNLLGKADGSWNVQTEDFTPKHTMYEPKWGRVMLYAYLSAGTVEWDDVIVKQIKPAPPKNGEKDRRPSSETKVRLKDLQK